MVCNLTITPMEAFLKLNKSDSPQSKEKKNKDGEHTLPKCCLWFDACHGQRMA